jgi:hypothetical protein
VKQLPVSFGTGPTPTMKGVTTNLSLTGIGLRAPTVLPVGSPLSLALTLPWNETAVLHGTVVWSRGADSTQGSLGVRLTQTDEHYVRWVAAVSDGTLRDVASEASENAEDVDIEIVEEAPEEDNVPTQKVWLRGAAE